MAGARDDDLVCSGRRLECRIRVDQSAVSFKRSASVCWYSAFTPPWFDDSSMACVRCDGLPP
eukprot:174416-Hanusia_phi.AAC.1